jgi:predicted CXXCH cytochrome family protein
MRVDLKILGLVSALFIGLILPAHVAHADGVTPDSNIVVAGISLPDIPKGEGKECIAPKAFMRRNHMNMLKHDRDETVHLGNRTIKASLKECVSCHAVNGADLKPVTVEDPKHFCRSCHDYVAVKIDCFECHASRPDVTLKSKLNPHSPEAKALAAYVAQPQAADAKGLKK